jgi:hypothetical protein
MIARSVRKCIQLNCRKFGSASEDIRRLNLAIQFLNKELKMEIDPIEVQSLIDKKQGLEEKIIAISKDSGKF